MLYCFFRNMDEHHPVCDLFAKFSHKEMYSPHPSEVSL